MVPKEFINLRKQVTDSLNNSVRFSDVLLRIFTFLDSQCSFLEENMNDCKDDPAEMFALVYSHDKMVRTLLLGIMDHVGMVAQSDQSETDCWLDSELYKRTMDEAMEREREKQIESENAPETNSDKLDSPS